MSITEDNNSASVRIKLNGRSIEATLGQTVLEVARANGIKIPTLCTHPALPPAGTCRLCVVEVKGLRGLPTSCTLPVEPGMEIDTETPRVREFRHAQLETIIAQHPRDCLVCGENLRCELQQLCGQIGVDAVPVTPRSHQPVEDPGVFFSRDYKLCITCGRCVRACHEVRGNHAIYYRLDDNELTVGTPLNLSLEDSGCRFCGACVDVCPTGALSDKRQRGLPDKVVTTICPYCGVGCQLKLEIKNGKIMQVVPDSDGPANHGQACVKGHFGIAEFVHSADRLTHPLIKRGGKLERASWDEALDLIAQRLSQFAPAEIGLVSSARSTNEDNFVLQKLARKGFHTNNVDHCARL